LITLNLVLLAPILATITAIVGLMIVYRAFKDKPIGLSIWLFNIFICYTIWGLSTSIMRVVGTQELARLFLQISFIVLQFSSYSIFRFHFNLIEKRGNRYFITYALTFLGSFNVALSFHSQLLNVRSTLDGYWVDNFAPTLLISNLLMNLLCGGYAVRTLIKLGAFGEFYSGQKGRNLYAYVGTLLVLTLAILLPLWLVRNIQESTDVTFFILLTIPVLMFITYTYGIRPISDFLLPQKVYGFVLVSPHGMTLFDKSLVESLTITLLHLLGSAIHVTNYTFKERLHSDSSLQVAELQDRVVMIFEDNDFIFCIIADYQTYQIEIMLKEFSRKILESNQFKTRADYQLLTFIDEMFVDFFKPKTGGIFNA
jgi:hypothetical protein